MRRVPLPLAASALVLALAVSLLAVLAAPGAAQVGAPPSFSVEIIDYPSTVQPGGSYNIRVRVTKPAGMALPAWTSGESPPKWEVRLYFYDGLNCYSKGEWTEIPSGSDNYLYSGWWDWRIQGASWTATTDTREFAINVKVVDYPRPSVDLSPPGAKPQPMNEIPVGGEIKLKARLRLRWGDTQLQFAGNQLTFTYYGQTFGGAYENTSVVVGGEYVEKYKVGSIYIEKSEAGYWQIDYDAIKSGVAVSAAPSAGVPWVVVAAAVAVIVAVVVLSAAVVVAKRKRKTPVEKSS